MNVSSVVRPAAAGAVGSVASAGRAAGAVPAPVALGRNATALPVKRTSAAQAPRRNTVVGVHRGTFYSIAAMEPVKDLEEGHFSWGQLVPQALLAWMSFFLAQRAASALVPEKAAAIAQGLVAPVAGAKKAAVAGAGDAAIIGLLGAQCIFLAAVCVLSWKNTASPRGIFCRSLIAWGPAAAWAYFAHSPAAWATPGAYALVAFAALATAGGLYYGLKAPLSQGKSPFIRFNLVGMLALAVTAIPAVAGKAAEAVLAPAATTASSATLWAFTASTAVAMVVYGVIALHTHWDARKTSMVSLISFVAARAALAYATTGAPVSAAAIDPILTQFYVWAGLAAAVVVKNAF
ncbi:unnamed protein product [Pedinophyceae sp. YPF-701]|nr:unnamed protein product [Pedinophyceae sp. YPF-701]